MADLTHALVAERATALGLEVFETDLRDVMGTVSHTASSEISSSG